MGSMLGKSVQGHEGAYFCSLISSSFWISVSFRSSQITFPFKSA